MNSLTLDDYKIYCFNDYKVIVIYTYVRFNLMQKLSIRNQIFNDFYFEQEQPLASFLLYFSYTFLGLVE